MSIQDNLNSNADLAELEALINNNKAECESENALIDSTLGYTKKNLLKNIAASTSANGIKVTVNNNKSVTIDGVAAIATNSSMWVMIGKPTLKPGKYILNGSPSGASANAYSYFISYENTQSIVTTDHEFTISKECEVTIQLRLPLLGQTISNVTFYPMIRSAEIKDGTYEPHTSSIDERLAIDRVTLGYTKKNELPNTAITQTISGLTFTVNNDKSVTVNGTATESVMFKIGALTSLSETYILTGSPKNEGIYGLRLYKGAVHVATDIGNGCNYIAANGEGLNVHIYVSKGTTLNNIIFYPMIRRAGITDKTYEPYIEDINTRLSDSGWIDLKSNGQYDDYTVLAKPIQARRKNGIVFVRGIISSFNQVAASPICKLPSDMLPDYAFSTIIIGTKSGSVAPVRFTINTSGELTLDRLDGVTSFDMSTYITNLRFELSYPI